MNKASLNENGCFFQKNKKLGLTIVIFVGFVFLLRNEWIGFGQAGMILFRRHFNELIASQ